MPGAPERDPRAGWPVEAFLTHVRTSTLNSATLRRTDSEFSALRTRELRLKCEERELALQVERGKYVAIEEVRGDVGRMIRAVVLTLEFLPRRLAVALAGRTPAECEAIMRDGLDEARRVIYECKWVTATEEAAGDPGPPILNIDRLIAGEVLPEPGDDKSAGQPIG